MTLVEYQQKVQTIGSAGRVGRRSQGTLERALPHFVRLSVVSHAERRRMGSSDSRWWGGGRLGGLWVPRLGTGNGLDAETHKTGPASLRIPKKLQCERIEFRFFGNKGPDFLFWMGLPMTVTIQRSRHDPQSSNGRSELVGRRFASLRRKAHMVVRRTESRDADILVPTARGAVRMTSVHHADDKVGSDDLE